VINYNTATVNQRLDVVVNNIDAGSSNGVLRLLDASAQTVATIALVKPCGTVSNKVLTFSGLPLPCPLTLVSAQIVAADIEDSTGLVVASGLTVGQSTASDIVMGNTIVSSGQIITLTYATITGV